MKVNNKSLDVIVMLTDINSELLIDGSNCIQSWDIDSVVSIFNDVIRNLAKGNPDNTIDFVDWIRGILEERSYSDAKIDKFIMVYGLEGIKNRIASI